MTNPNMYLTVGTIISLASIASFGTVTLILGVLHPAEDPSTCTEDTDCYSGDGCVSVACVEGFCRHSDWDACPGHEKPTWCGGWICQGGGACYESERNCSLLFPEQSLCTAWNCDAQSLQCIMIGSTVCDDGTTAGNVCTQCNSDTGQCTVKSADSLPCGSAEVCCDGTCVHTATHNAHCGGCGIVCPLGEICRGSVCCLPAGGSGVNCSASGATPCCAPAECHSASEGYCCVPDHANCTAHGECCSGKCYSGVCRHGDECTTGCHTNDTCLMDCCNRGTGSCEVRPRCVDPDPADLCHVLTCVGASVGIDPEHYCGVDASASSAVHCKWVNNTCTVEERADLCNAYVCIPATGVCVLSGPVDCNTTATCKICDTSTGSCTAPVANMPAVACNTIPTNRGPVCCDGICTGLRSNTADCGSCGNACDQGQTCKLRGGGYGYACCSATEGAASGSGGTTGCLTDDECCDSAAWAGNPKQTAQCSINLNATVYLHTTLLNTTEHYCCELDGSDCTSDSSCCTENCQNGICAPYDSCGTTPPPPPDGDHCTLDVCVNGQWEFKQKDCATQSDGSTDLCYTCARGSGLCVRDTCASEEAADKCNRYACEPTTGKCHPAVSVECEQECTACDPADGVCKASFANGDSCSAAGDRHCCMGYCHQTYNRGPLSGEGDWRKSWYHYKSPLDDPFCGEACWQCDPHLYCQEIGNPPDPFFNPCCVPTGGVCDPANDVVGASNSSYCCAEAVAPTDSYPVSCQAVGLNSGRCCRGNGATGCTSNDECCSSLCADGTCVSNEDCHDIGCNSGAHCETCACLANDTCACVNVCPATGCRLGGCTCDSTQRQDAGPNVVCADCKDSCDVVPGDPCDSDSCDWIPDKNTAICRPWSDICEDSNPLYVAEDPYSPDWSKYGVAATTALTAGQLQSTCWACDLLPDGDLSCLAAQDKTLCAYEAVDYDYGAIAYPLSCCAAQDGEESQCVSLLNGLNMSGMVEAYADYMVPSDYPTGQLNFLKPAGSSKSYSMDCRQLWTDSRTLDARCFPPFWSPASHPPQHCGACHRGCGAGQACNAQRASSQFHGDPCCYNALSPSFHWPVPKGSDPEGILGPCCDLSWYGTHTNLAAFQNSKDVVPAKLEMRRYGSTEDVFRCCLSDASSGCTSGQQCCSGTCTNYQCGHTPPPPPVCKKTGEGCQSTIDCCGQSTGEVCLGSTKTCSACRIPHAPCDAATDCCSDLKCIDTSFSSTAAKACLHLPPKRWSPFHGN